MNAGHRVYAMRYPASQRGTVMSGGDQVATITVDLTEAKPTPAERLAAYCASIGRPLAPWQVRHVEQAED